MQIECKIKRKGGSQVTLGDATYDFQPDKQGRHVAEVEDESHADRLLSIPEYTEVSDDPDAPASTATPTEDEDLEAARDEYEAFFGKKAHHMMKADTIRERIQQERGAEA